MQSTRNQKQKQWGKQKIIECEHIDWLLNLTDSIPKHELRQSNMKSLPTINLQNDYLMESQIYTYCNDQNAFVLKTLQLYPNMIIKDNEFLILSTCQMEKKIVSYKEFQAQGLVFSNQLGQTFLFFTQTQDLIDWTKQSKSFCKLSGFLQKYTIKEKMQAPNIFACVKNKSNKLHCVHIYKLTDLQKHPLIYEQLMNEINIQMSMKHPCLINYEALYEDNQFMYILYEFWIGDPLYKLIEQGLMLNSTQIARIMYQLMKFIAQIHKQNLYHSQITPANIYILRTLNLNELQIVIQNFAYREELTFQLIKKLPKQWIPPEIFNETNKNINPQKIDIYQIGCIFFYLCKYTPQCKDTNNGFHKVIEGFEITYEQLLKEENQKSINFSLSQIDLLKQLINPNPQLRKELHDLCNHHWFVNENAKSKSYGKQQLLPSLRTILEIREQSSFDLKAAKSIDQQDSILLSHESSEGDFEDTDFLDLISEEENELTMHLQMLNSQSFTIRKNDCT